MYGWILLFCSDMGCIEAPMSAERICVAAGDRMLVSVKANDPDRLAFAFCVNQRNGDVVELEFVGEAQ